MRNHGNYKKRDEINCVNDAFRAARGSVPEVLCDGEAGTATTPVVSEGDTSTAETSGVEAPSLIHGEVDFEPVIDEAGHTGPLNSEPMA